MKEVSVVLLGFGNVGQSVARLVQEHDGYEREGVRLRLASVFDRGGGVDASGRSAQLNRPGPRPSTPRPSPSCEASLVSHSDCP